MPHICLALSQFRPTKGEYADNVSRIGAVVTQAAQLDPKPDLVVFPETATSGYFVEGGVKELAVTADACGPAPAARRPARGHDVVVGCFDGLQDHNSNFALSVSLVGDTHDARLAQRV